MTILSGFPTGLLDIVGSQNFGVAPKDMAEIVAPTIELGDLYGLTRQVGTLAQLAAPANGNNYGAGLVVPKGEVWKIVALGLLLQHGVGVTGDYTLTLTQNFITVPLTDTTSVVASVTRWVVSKVSTPFWIRAGDELGVFISALVGAPTVTVTTTFQRFRA